MTALNDIELLGEPRPIAAAEPWHTSVQELLSTWGAGVLGARFTVFAPSDPRARQLTAFVRGRGAELYARGYWQQVPLADWAQLHVFAEGQRSDVLAFAGEQLYWLDAVGHAMPAGRTVAELVTNFFRSRPIVVCYGEALGATFTAEREVIDTMLAALDAGDEPAAERTFELLIGSADPIPALQRFVAAVAARDSLPRDVRIEWSSTAVKMLRRRLDKQVCAELGLDAVLAALRSGAPLDPNVIEHLGGAGAKPWDTLAAIPDEESRTLTLDLLASDWRTVDPGFDVDAVLRDVAMIPPETRRTVLIALSELSGGSRDMPITQLDGTDPNDKVLAQRAHDQQARLDAAKGCVPLLVLALRRLFPVVVPRLISEPMASWRSALRSMLTVVVHGFTNIGWVLSYQPLPKPVIDELLALDAELPQREPTYDLIMFGLREQTHDDRVYALFTRRAADWPGEFAKAVELRKDRSQIPLLWKIARSHGSYDSRVLGVLARFGDEKAADLEFKVLSKGI